MKTLTVNNHSGRILRALSSVNFFMADMQAGIGPFLGIFLLAKGGQSGLIGTVMPLGSVAGMSMTAPARAVIDVTTHKRRYEIIPGICTVAASAFILVLQNFRIVALSQVATAIVVGSALSGYLGMKWGIPAIFVLSAGRALT